MKTHAVVMTLSGFLVVGIANAAGDFRTANISDIENQIRLAREQYQDLNLKQPAARQADVPGDETG